MKKKIKDLTIEECQKFCEKRMGCDKKCPMFFEIGKSGNYCPFVAVDGKVKDFYLEREIEVDE